MQPIEKASLINDVFSENFNSTIPPLSPADLHNFQAETTSSLPDHILCTEEEVVNLVSELDTGKASGPDGISGRMLKGTIQSISPFLTDLFNLSISTGKFPQKWKISSVVPIPKTPTNSTDPYKYRPIPLLSVVSKLLEKHIYALLLQHLIENNFLSESQWGFTSGKSTVTATFLLESGYGVSLIFLT